MNSTDNQISIVLASLASYNPNNDAVASSTWIKLNSYHNWQEIEQELTRQDFDLAGADKQLFIYEIDGFPYDYIDWRTINPQDFFVLLQQSGVLTDTDKYEKMLAYIEVQSFQIWQELVLKHGDAWDDDIYLYPKYDWYDYGKMIFTYSGLELPKFLEMFYDFEALGEHFKHYDVQEYSNGLIEIL